MVLFSSLRARLIALVATAVVPALVLVLYDAYRHFSEAGQHAQQEALRLARLAAAEQDRLAEGASQLLAAILQAPVVRTDHSPCRDYLQLLLEQSQLYVNLLALRYPGGIYCSARAIEKELPVMQPDYLRYVVNRPDQVIADVFVDAASRRGVMAYGIAASTTNPGPRPVTVALLDLAWFNRLALETELPIGSTITVFDDAGTIYARHPEPGRWVGQRLPLVPLVYSVLSRHGHGTLQTTGLDGVDRLYGYTRIGGEVPPKKNVYVAVGIPAAAAQASARAEFLRNLSILGVVALASVGAAWWVGELSLRRPIRALAQSTQRMASGEWPERVALRAGTEELHRLADTFNDMVATLRQRQTRIEQAHARIADILARITDGFIALDENWMCTYVNRQGADILGLPVDALLGANLFEAFPRFEQHPIGAALKRAMSERVTVRLEDHFAPCGIWCTTAVYPSPHGVCAFFLDMTREHLAAAALRSSEERLRLALDAAGMGTFDWELATGLIRWTEEHARLFGMRLEDFDGRYETFAARVHREDLAGVVQAVNTARRLRTMYRHEYRIVWPDGSVHWVAGQGQFHYDAAGAPARMIGVVMNIDERKRHEQAHVESEARLRTIIETEPECVKLVGPDGTLLEMNQAGLRMIEADDPGQVVGKVIYPMIMPEYRNKFRALVEDVLKLGKPGSLEFEIAGLKGSRRWLETHMVALDQGERGRCALGITRDVTERKRADERLMFLAHHDLLTELPNRALFDDRLNQEMIEARRHGRLIGVLLLDLDRFKTINDMLGHAAGDRLLREAAERLRRCVRDGDTVARLSGDEFALILADVRHLDDIARIAQKFLDAFGNPFHLDHREFYITPSVGIALYPHDGRTGEVLLRNADAAMYRAKEAGRNTFLFYTSEMNRHAAERLNIESALRHALERDELFLEYQPVIACDTGRIVGLEALLRWNHPERGRVAPTEFIPLAEETGLIIPIGEWVLFRVCEQLARWSAEGITTRVAVNVSTRQLHRKQLPVLIRRAIEASAIDPTWLEIELTESILARGDEIVGLLREIDRIGVTFAIDDFGTGYSSLSYLKRFPIDKLKIDQSFVRGVPESGEDSAISTAVVAMAHSLGLTVVAEGIETIEQLRFLQQLRCNYAQGYLFSTPLDVPVVTSLLREGHGLIPGDSAG